MKSSPLLLLAMAWATPAAAERPVAQFYCIYDGVDAATRAQAGEKFFFQDRTHPQPAFLFGQAARDCVRRYGWTDAELAPAARFALAQAGRDYARGWLAARAIPPDRLDEIYRSTPLEDRTVVNGSATLRNRMLTAIGTGGGADYIERGVSYLVLLRNLERAEREWAALPD